MEQSLWKTFWGILKMLNMPLPYSPAILPLGVYPKELKIYIHTKCLYGNVQQYGTSLVRRREQLRRVSMDEWVNPVRYP